MAITELIATAYFTNGDVDTVGLSESVNTHVDVGFTPGGGIDIESLSLADGMGALTPLKIKFIDTCVPDNPFYVRWINRLGGWEYHMFATNKRQSVEVKAVDTYTPHTGGLISARRTMELLTVERIDTAEVGEEMLDYDEYLLLASMALSPRIDVFNTTLQQWEGITLEGKHTLRWDTRSSLGAVDYSFRLIDQNNQF